MNEGMPYFAGALEREEIMKGQEEQDPLEKLVGLKHLLCRGDHDRLTGRGRCSRSVFIFLLGRWR